MIKEDKLQSEQQAIAHEAEVMEAQGHDWQPLISSVVTLIVVKDNARPPAVTHDHVRETYFGTPT